MTAYPTIPPLSIPEGETGAPELLPPCGGYWLRLPDGSLQPRDDDTAIAAGLMPPPEPVPDQSPAQASAVAQDVAQDQPAA